MVMSTFPRPRAVLSALAFAGATGQAAFGQPEHVAPPMGVPFGRSIGPPSDNVDDFLGTWKISTRARAAASRWFTPY
jgi:hypothetical protein